MSRWIDRTANVAKDFDEYIVSRISLRKLCTDDFNELFHCLMPVFPATHIKRHENLHIFFGLFMAEQPLLWEFPRLLQFFPCLCMGCHGKAIDRLSFCFLQCPENRSWHTNSLSQMFPMDRPQSLTISYQHFSCPRAFPFQRLAFPNWLTGSRDSSRFSPISDGFNFLRTGLG